MIWTVAVAAGALVAAGVYLALGRDLLRMAVGISLLGAGASLVVLSAGRADRVLPPFVEAGAASLGAGGADPVPQALVLTAIVIGFSLTCVSLLLVLAIRQQTGVADSDDLDSAEPRRKDGKPLVLPDHD